MILQQVGLDHSRHLRRMPFFDVSSISISNHAKFPTGIKAARCWLRGLGRAHERRTQSQCREIKGDSIQTSSWNATHRSFPPFLNCNGFQSESPRFYISFRRKAADTYGSHHFAIPPNGNASAPSHEL